MHDARTVVITGANSGIGFETARHCAKTGWRVVLACRNPAKAEEAAARIRAECPDAWLAPRVLDVSESDSVAAFAQALSADPGRLDVLVNNAGVAQVPLGRNSAGHELHLATNYLGAFALTGLLLPLIEPRPGNRIVNVGSLAHRVGRLDFDDLDWQRRPYNDWQAYAASKLALITFTLELARRLEAAGSPLVALAAHPGFARTNIHLNSPTLRRRHEARSGRLHRHLERLVPDAERAARPVIHATTAPEVRGGDYFGPGGLFETGIGGRVRPARISRRARDPEMARRLWELSEALTGVRYLSDL